MNHFHLAIPSTKRPQNVEFMQKFCGHICHWYVNAGEAEAYSAAGAHKVYESKPGISAARNMAMRHAFDIGMPSIQISDDIKNIKKIHLDASGKRKTQFVSFGYVCELLIALLAQHSFYYGGVAVTSNPLNYTGIDISFDKLIVCDLNCFMPGCMEFDETLLQKEDYDMTIRQLMAHGGVVRLDNILCDFPHRQNAGGANTYRDNVTEKAAMQELMKKWPRYVKPHATRENQVALLPKIILQDRVVPPNNLFNL